MNNECVNSKPTTLQNSHSFNIQHNSIVFYSTTYRFSFSCHIGHFLRHDVNRSVTGDSTRVHRYWQCSEVLNVTRLRRGFRVWCDSYFMILMNENLKVTLMLVICGVNYQILVCDSLLGGFGSTH